MANRTLFLIGAIICAIIAVFAFTDLPKNYEQNKGTTKLSIIWSYILADNNQPGSWYGTLDMIALLLRSDWVTGHVYSDILPDGRKKLIHTVGVIAKAKFVWVNGIPYTGMFKGANNVLLRASTALAAETDHMAPGISIKAFRDGYPSANLIAMYELNGQKSLNFFENILCTRIAERPDLPFKLHLLGNKFKIQSSYPGSYGTSEFANHTQDGSWVGNKPVFPWALVFQPNPSLSNAMSGNKNIDIPSVLVDLINGTEVVYKVFAVPEPFWTGSLQYIGYMQLVSGFHKSKFSDMSLFFKHTFIEDDFSYRTDWPIAFGDKTKKQWEIEGQQVYGPMLPPWSNPN